MWPFGAPATPAQSLAILGASAWAVGLARRLDELGVRVILVDPSPQRTLAARLERASVHVCEPLAVDPKALSLTLKVDLVIAAGPTGGQAALQARHFARALGPRRVLCAETSIPFGPRSLLGPGWTCARINGAWDLGWRFTAIDCASRTTLQEARTQRAAILGTVEPPRGFRPAGGGEHTGWTGIGPPHHRPGRRLVVYSPSAGTRP